MSARNVFTLFAFSLALSIPALGQAAENKPNPKPANAAKAEPPQKAASAERPRQADATHTFVTLTHLIKDEARLSTVAQLVHRLTGVEVIRESSLNVVALTGPTNRVLEAEALLKRFDVPEAAKQEAPRQLQFTVYLIEAGNASTEAGAGAATIPSELQSAVEQMRSAFAYKEYRLLDTLLLTGQSGTRNLMMNGLLPVQPDMPRESQYNIDIVRPTYVESAKAITVEEFRLGLRLPYFVGVPGDKSSTPPPIQYFDAGLRTKLEIREGQKMVLGKLNKGHSERTIFVVVTAKAGN